MVNKNLFASIKSLLTRADSQNEAGGRACQFPAKHALVQMAATGCFNGTFYTGAEDQLDRLIELVDEIDDNLFLAKLAVYARRRAMMKDMPAALLCILSTRDTELTHRIFDHVIDNGRMLRTLFQMVRSGRFGRKGLSSSLQRAFRRWLCDASTGRLLSASIGSDPSLRDVLRMARPSPETNERRALFGWLTGKEIDRWAPAGPDDLPEEIRLLGKYRRAESAAEQIEILQRLDVRWDLLASDARSTDVWAAIARNMGSQALRMNLNTLVRHKVIGDGAPNCELIDRIAERIGDADQIRRSKQLPYQFLAAYLNADDRVPEKIKASLHKAAEIACGNVPEFPGPVVIGLDVSGSMTYPVTGWQNRGRSSKVRCVDVAALFVAAVLRRNPDSVVIPFDWQAYNASVDPGDTILSLASRLAKFGGGGTDCSIPLREANTRYRDRRFAGVVLVSDYESWVYRDQAYAGPPRRNETGVMSEWRRFVDNQLRLGGHDIPSPKLVCIDLQPYSTTQAPDRKDTLNVGGFSDAVFKIVASFLADDGERLVGEVESVKL